MAIFVKPKKLASAPSRERKKVVPELHYVKKISPEAPGAKKLSKKLLKDFSFTVILLPICYVGGPTLN